MNKLYYVGFNGYRQCPTNESHPPKVIADWTSIQKSDVMNICCSHKVVVLETKAFFEVYGTFGFNTAHFLKIQKPTITDNCSSCDEVLVASAGTDLWQFKYEELNWKKINLSFLNNEEESIWKKKENKVVKFSLKEDTREMILLLNNGSIWKLSEEGHLNLFLPPIVEKAIDVASGLEHTLILTESGCVLSFGNGARGQLGNGELNSTEIPAQISALEGLKITKIDAGGWHSCAISDSGDLYVWGWNNYGQLSAFEDEQEIGLTALPVFVNVGGDIEIKVVDVSCGIRHTIAQLENRELYTTGWNAYSQLGLSLTSDKISRFTKTNFSTHQNVKSFCGPWYTILLDKNASS